MTSNKTMTEHLARVACALRDLHGAWTSVTDLATASSVSKRTAQEHLTHLVKVGVAECADMAPARRYRWLVDDEVAGPFLNRLDVAVEVFGLGGKKR